MAKRPDENRDPDAAIIYEIRIDGHLAPYWIASYGDMRLELEDDGVTLITGPVTDQAALYGLLRKVRDLGLTLLSVQAVGLDVVDDDETHIGD